jgi:mRNA interferase MazF
MRWWSRSHPKTGTTKSEPEHQLATKSGSRGYVPERGDLVWLTFDPQAGHEQAGRRPAVVLSPAHYNSRAGLAVVVPVTRQEKNYPFEVPLPEAAAVAGVVLADQMKSVDWRAREAKRITALPSETVAAILQRAALLLKAS